MVVRSCQVCEERESDLLISLTANGESRFLCLPCSLPWLQTIWDQAGLPRFEVDFPDIEVEEAGTAPVDTSGPGTVRVADYDPPEPEGDEDADDEATPEAPGVLEQLERDAGAKAVKPANGNRPRKRPAGKVPAGGVAEKPSDAPGHHG